MDFSESESCVSCSHCSTRIFGLFAQLSKLGLEGLDEHRRTRRYQRGEVLFQEGNGPNGVYCIHAGTAKLYKTTPEGDVQIVRWAGGGELLGQASLFDGSPLSVTAEAVTEMEVCHFPQSVLAELVDREPTVARELISRLGRQLREAEGRLVGVAHRPVPERVAELLLQLDTGREEAVPLSRREMSQTVGTTPETLARVLTSFHQQGFIKRTRQTIRLVNRPELRRLAGLE